MRDIRVKSMEWGAEFHAAREKEVIVIGGVGSGKSIEGSSWLIEGAIEYPYARHYYMGAAYPAMREGTTETLCQRLDDYGLRYDLSKTTLEVKVLSSEARGARFIPTSSEVYKRLKGQMIDRIWCDEAQTWNEGSDTEGELAYDFVLTRLRPSESAQKHHPNLQPQLRLTANPPHRTSHWLYRKFVKNKAAGVRLFHVTTFDNVLLPRRDEYIETLRGAMSPELFRIEVLGEWGNLGVGTVYKSFDPNRNVRPVDYNPSLPLRLTNDFGVHPRVALICQIYHGATAGEQDEILHVVDEIRLENGSTDELIEEFIRRYPAHVVSELQLYGDPAGKARNSTTGMSDWIMMTDDPRMQPYRPVLKHRDAAPLIVDRVNATNSKLYNARGEVGVYVDPRCQHTIDDLQHTRWKDGTRALDHGSPAKGILRTHLSDALGYLIEYEWPLTPGPSFGFGSVRR